MVPAAGAWKKVVSTCCVLETCQSYLLTGSFECLPHRHELLEEARRQGLPFAQWDGPTSVKKMHLGLAHRPIGCGIFYFQKDSCLGTELTWKLISTLVHVLVEAR